MEVTAHAIGIDLGTTYCCIASYLNGKPDIIKIEGQSTMPSYVAFTEDERLIGPDAESQAARNPANTVYAVKRLIGRKRDDEEVEAVKQRVGYELVGGDDNRALIEVTSEGQKKTFCPQEISAFLLKHLKEAAEKAVGGPVKAVVTIPAYFNNSQRQATEEACEIARLEVLRFINEPTAAAVAYCLDKQKMLPNTSLVSSSEPRDRDPLYIIFDFGGGTLDVTLLTLDDDCLQVKGTAGDCHLGGLDFDNCLVDYIVPIIEKNHGKELCSNERVKQRLRRAAEAAKKNLSRSESTEFVVEGLLGGGNDFHHRIDRSKFEELCRPLLERIRTPLQQVLSDEGIDPSDIDEIVLVGGSTRIPSVRDEISVFFGKEPRYDIDPDEAVARGAAIQANNLLNCPSDAMLLLDVTPLSLGIRTKGGKMETLITRNRTIPCKETKQFTNSFDNQEEALFPVFQGERPLADDNLSLGEFTLSGIAPGPAHTAKFDVTFEIDENGILKVSAVDRGTARSKEIEIKDSFSLTKEEVKRMIEDAERFKAKDNDATRRIAESETPADGQLAPNTPISISDEQGSDGEERDATHDSKESNKRSLEDGEGHPHKRHKK